MKRMVLVLLLLTALAASAADFSFVILGDRTGSAQGGIYESVVAESLGEDADFYLTVGDQIQGYRDEPEAVRAQWAEYREITAPITVPLYLTPGNHDIWDDASEGIWREETGHDPSYSFDYEGVHFVILDTSRWESAEELPDASRAWLEEDLSAHADAKLTFVFYHKPYWYDTLAEGKPDPLHDLFLKYGVDAVFNGHYHTYGAAEYGGIDYTILGSSGAAMFDPFQDNGHFFHYTVVEVIGGKFWVQIVPLAVNERWERDRITAAELKLFDRIERDGVVLSPVDFDETVPGPLEVRLTLTDASNEPVSLAPRWETIYTPWTVTPPDLTAEVAPGEPLTVSFRAENSGSPFPLPLLQVDYPYRADRAYHCEQRLPLRRTQTVARLAAPVVDGDPTEAEWSAAGRTALFCSPQGGEELTDGTVFRWGYDDTNLYIAARCSQAPDRPLFIVADEQDHPSLPYDDCVGFFFAPPGETGDIYQIYVNAHAVKFDQRIFTDADGNLMGDPDWNADYRAATRYGEDGWTIELAIPFAALGAAPPAPGDSWAVNFRRKEIAAGTSADWQYPISYDARLYGSLLFE